MNITRKAWWLICTSIIYVLTAIINVEMGSHIEFVFIQMVWIIITSMPLWILPLHKIIFNNPS